MGMGGQHHAPAALPPGKIRYPLYRRLGWPQGRSGRVRKISPPPEFDPRTVQPVASRYIDYAIQALHHFSGYSEFPFVGPQVFISPLSLGIRTILMVHPCRIFHYSLVHLFLNRL